MARQSSEQREMFKFLQSGNPSAIAIFLSEHPAAAISFLGLRSELQLARFNQLLKSHDDKELEVALKRIDEALEKRAEFLSSFIDDDAPAPAPRAPIETPAPPIGSITQAAVATGQNLQELPPQAVKQDKSFGDSVRLLTKRASMVAKIIGATASMVTGIAMTFAVISGLEEPLPQHIAEPIEQIATIEEEYYAPLEITVSRDQPATALAALNTNFSQANIASVPHLSYTNSGIQYRDWSVPETVASATLNSAEITGIPAQLLFSMIGPESSFIANNFNETTKACGLGQFIPSTLYEKVYNYGTLIGYPHIQNLVERFVERRDQQKRPYYGFQPKSEEAAAQIRATCMDPAFNTRLQSVYIARNIGHMQDALKQFASRGHEYYPVNATQVYLAHFSGIGRALDMIEDMHTNNGQTIAHMYFNRVATDANLNYLFVNGDRNAPRTVAQFISFLKDDKKLGDSVMPDMRNWSERRDIIQANVRLASSGTGLQSGLTTPFN